MLLAGTNNVGNRDARSDGEEPRQPISRAAFKPSCATMQAKAPKATIIVTAIFPRNDNMAVMP